MTNATKNSFHQPEDALAYLPHKKLIEYRPQQLIYAEESPPDGLSLIVLGRVKVTTTMEDGSKLVIGIFQQNEFFGTCALLARQPREQATALENSSLMTWTCSEIEAQIECHPQLGLALTKLLVARCLDFGERLQSIALDKTPERIGLSLIRLAKSGTAEPDGAVRIPPLTHEVLAGYIGTSREMVTAQLGQYRRFGLIRYSRKAIHVYPQALAAHMRKHRY